MLWLFVILGAATSARALYVVIRPSRGSIAWSRLAAAAAMPLLCAAWLMGHHAVTGWVCLLGAVTMASAEPLLTVIARRPGARDSVRPRPADISAESSDESTSLAAEAGAGADGPFESEGTASASFRAAGIEQDGDRTNVTTPSQAAQTPSQTSGLPPQPPDAPSVSGTGEKVRPGDDRQPPTPGAGSDARLGGGQRAPSPIILSSCVLLRQAHELVGSVFVASLRRVGERDAVLVKASPQKGVANALPQKGVASVRIGETDLILKDVSQPVDRRFLDDAAAQSWDWPDAAEVVHQHAAHVVVTSRSPARTPPAEVARLHYQAVAALGEFAAVAAVLWPSSGRLVSPANAIALRARPVQVTAMGRSCLGFRVFAPTEGASTRRAAAEQAATERASAARASTETGAVEAKPTEGASVEAAATERAWAEGAPAEGTAAQYVCDSIGLHLFGLPDVQIVTTTEPDEAVSAAVYQVADQVFAASWACAADAVVEAGGARWRVSYAEARFPPHRRVIELVQAAEGA